jgi:7,8-dihydropterin-6-yl-methyl-4-(beta-D-ribofuranosyl)aminobenzene 5'-phosphate synthase
METVFKREGIDKMLRDRGIEFLYITHENFDHFFSLEATLK